MAIPKGNSRRGSLPFQVGQRLREFRMLRGWTLRDLARESGVSQGMLSKLESRSVSPSLAVIAKIAAAFGQTIGQFLGEEGEGARPEMTIVRRRQRSVVVNDATGYAREQLSPPLSGPGLEFVRSVIPARSGPLVFPPHAMNVEELVFVERGTLRVSVGTRTATLRAGDVVLLKPTARHAYENRGPEPCVCYIILDSHLAPGAVHARAAEGAAVANGRPDAARRRARRARTGTRTTSSRRQRARPRSGSRPRPGAASPGTG